MKQIFTLTCISLIFTSLHAQGPMDPQDLLMDVNVTKNWTTVANIENTFNTARRQEETQLALGANAIMNLVLPSQAVWDGYSIDQKALYIMNDERTSRAGINYGMGAVKGLPFNGIEANIDQVAQDWAQYNVNNNVFEHCHPTMNNADCPAGRISGAYPNGCTEFGGGIENLHASSSGTIAMTDVALDAIFGWIYEDAGSNWGHRHAQLAQDYDDNFGEVNQEGLVGFGIAQTTTGGVQWKTVVVVNFTNPVATAQSGGCGYNITVSTNSLNPCATPPTINSVTTVQPPDCNNQIGSITVNATGAGTLQYSVNNGATWQLGNTFTNLTPGNYTVAVRLQANTNCVTNHNMNPVVLQAPMGCNGDCTDYVAMDVPIVIPGNAVGTITSTINVPTGGMITDVNIKNLNGPHGFVGDLTFTLMSPQGTSVILIQNQCNDDNTGFNINLDDQAGNALACPLSNGDTQMPQNPLSAFNGENPMGNWQLLVNDNFAEDGGSLQGWTLEICTQGAPAQGYTCATAIELTQPGTFNAPGPSQGNGAIPGSGFTHANWYRFTPPMTGMINIFTCGLAGAGNQHNHVYTVNTGSCATLDLNDVAYTEDRGCTQNQADGVRLENVPVTMGVPIYIEWDDALSTTPFTWTLEYQGGCTADVIVSAATTMGNTVAGNSITTQNMVAVNGAAVFSAANINLNAGFEVPAGNCFEANNVGCGYNGTLMCDGGGEAMGTCASPHIITCGQVFQGNNTGGVSNWSSYQAGAFTDLTGPEKIHTLVIPGNTTRTISLSGLNADLDMMIATTCDPATVFVGAATLNDPETVMVQNNTANPVTYYIIVDGYQGATSTYSLSCN